MRLIRISDLTLALLLRLPHTLAIPKVTDTLLLPLRIPPTQCLDFTTAKINIPTSLGNPATQCSWPDILQCAASEINCGQECVETVQRVQTDIPPLSPQCSSCLSASTVSHCAICWGTHIPNGQAPRPYSSLPSISRDELCAAAKQVPEAGCIADGFCPAASAASSGEDTEPSGLALIEQIIAELGGGAVGNIDVKPAAGVASTSSATATSNGVVGSTSTSVSAPGVTNGVSISPGGPSSSSSTSSSTTRGGGRAAGLCGRYYCVDG